ncbi:TSUP family transporter [Agrococcus versicolor]|uniref:Probable membrane transporter protein n=1 Tax=Agrococcus versicolor TaxID=501482 RepID=A0ABN3ALJ5_9MICO
MDWSFVVALVALAVGAIAQRTVGMGFGLVVTPTMVLAVGPLEAVLVVNVFGVVACAMIIGRVWRDIDWRGLAWLVVPAIALTIPGILLARAADADVLKIAVGVLALVGVAVSAGFTRSERSFDGPGLRVPTGALVGVLNSSVGLGAPVIGMFAILSRWEHRVFAATMQPFWILLSLSTVVSRQLVAPGGAPPWQWWMWLLAVAPILVGVVAGDRIAARIDQAVARRAVIVFSLLSGIAVLVTGIVGLATA